MKKLLLGIFAFFLTIYVILCVSIYFYQEKIIFYPEKLPADYKFSFVEDFEEIAIQTQDKKYLSSVLFKAQDSKGVIFYLHGNGGSIKDWGEVAQLYKSMNYDTFILDYRGYGKSQDEINSKEQLFSDIESAYKELLKRYPEDRIIILGYSVGTGLAAKLASAHHAKMLILQAPYYSMKDEMNQKFSFLPKFLLKYNFETNEYLKTVTSPVIIFHGDKDEVIHYKASLKLKNNFKKGDSLIVLKNQYHNGITDNLDYQNSMRIILDSDKK
ncbi:MULTISPECIES: alpha/beta hydrolase [unclassified Chryseobacterium]|uniref:alpha/beta hydrolase n=1 Tax=unclassified Chryseobacterium TaxID=2593645 RepID=UPI00100B9E6C|nr:MULTISPECIES: alpha/beta fold hydrolase [unclassified Chryseobacterium]RXM49852.1 alpha/beta hydrolase [Chryseobacterium sp. CH25]RXM62000.1 alpha/beta hydrolase [Chryseobacterium sp. CH1]